MAYQTITSNMTDEEFDHHVIGILARELGVGGFARYLMLHRSGKGDYTAERHQWLDSLTLEDIQRDLAAQNTP